MSIHGRNELKWDNLKLKFKKKVLFEVVPFDAGLPNDPPMEDSYFPTFKVKWPDGVLSEDYYNLTRAKEHAVDIALSNLNNDIKKRPGEAH